MPRSEDVREARERSLRNAQYLIETQMRIVTDISTADGDVREAAAMLRRFMDLEASIRWSPEVRDTAPCAA